MSVACDTENCIYPATTTDTITMNDTTCIRTVCDRCHIEIRKFTGRTPGVELESDHWGFSLCADEPQTVDQPSLF